MAVVFTRSVTPAQQVIRHEPRWGSAGVSGSVVVGGVGSERWWTWQTQE